MNIQRLELVPFETSDKKNHGVKLIAVMAEGFPAHRNPLSIPIVWTNNDFDKNQTLIVKALFENGVNALNDLIEETLRERG